MSQKKSRSSGGSTSSKSRVRPIQMEPELQALLMAEGRAAELIARARGKRAALMRQAISESQAEIERFRRERERRYQLKLREATQIDQYRGELERQRRDLLEQMAKRVREERTAPLRQIIADVLDRISVRIRNV